MKVIGAEKWQLLSAAENAHVDLQELRFTNQAGTSWQFRLRLRGETWRRVSASGRRVAAVCWHGHATFMASLYVLAPDAKIRTTIANYNSADDFLSTFRQTGQSNIGSIVNPLYLEDACLCHLDNRRRAVEIVTYLEGINAEMRPSPV